MRLLYGDTFTVVGISTRTSNAQEMSGNGSIPRLWQQLLESNALEHLAQRSDNNILALYTNYENGADGAYDYILGAKVSEAKDLPAGMVVCQVPAGDYAVTTTERGPQQQVIPAAWQRIWSDPQLQAGSPYRRAFQVDFEVWDHRSANPADVEVDIYLGVRPAR